MRSFMAKNPKQLDLCLRLLYFEKVPFLVEVCETNKKKIAYEIKVEVTEQKMDELVEKYRILIS